MNLRKLFLLLYFFTFTHAQEPTMAFLVKINSNEVQTYKIHNSIFECRPYAIVTIDELILNNAVAQSCKQVFESYYQKNPYDIHYVLSILELQQMYHLEFKNKECISYIRGQKTLSELLLLNGLAIYERNFSDREFQKKFFDAQKTAQYLKRGLWKDALMKTCIGSYYE